MAPKRRRDGEGKTTAGASHSRKKESTAAASDRSPAVTRLAPQRPMTRSYAKNPTPPSPLPEPRRKRAKKQASAGEVCEEELPKTEVGVESSGAGEKAIIIEHCTQCSSFRKRAETVETGLKKGVPDVVVKINPSKPRRGCFEIRDESGHIFVSLLDMPRPFTKMKQLDMEKLIEEVVAFCQKKQ